MAGKESTAERGWLLALMAIVQRSIGGFYGRYLIEIPVYSLFQSSKQYMKKISENGTPSALAIVPKPPLVLSSFHLSQFPLYLDPLMLSNHFF